MRFARPTIENFRRGQAEPAAATTVWHDFAKNPKTVYGDSRAHFRKSIAEAGIRRETG